MTFVEFLRDNNLDFRQSGEHHHVSGGWIGLDCPYCSPDNLKFRLGYNLRSGYMTCWACGPKKTLDVLQRLTNKPINEIRNFLGKMARDITPTEFKVQGKYTEPEGLQPLMTQHAQYLQKRGLNLADLYQIWKIDSGTVRSSKLPWRIFIPIYHRSERVSWTTRSIFDNGLRYISAPPDKEKYHHKDLLYGEDYVRNTVIICEGPIDVWKIGPGAVCTFGTSFTWGQLNRIAHYSKRYVCFDNQPNAQVQAMNLVNRLSVMPGETYNIKLDSGKDPGDADESELKHLRRLVSI